jgi:hypothetical protein
MSNIHVKAIEAVLQAAQTDIDSTIEERGISDRDGEDADEAVLDVAILHAYRVFMRICEEQGLPADADLFAEVAAELAEEIENEPDDEDEE